MKLRNPPGNWSADPKKKPDSDSIWSRVEYRRIKRGSMRCSEGNMNAKWRKGARQYARMIAKNAQRRQRKPRPV